MSKPKKENLFVLDIDDTLTKSEFQHQFAYLEAMKHLEISNIKQNWGTYAHMTDSYILKENYESNLNKAFSFDIVKEFEERMTNAISKLTPVTAIPGATAFIEQVLAASSFGVCYATGSFLKPALLKLKQAKIPAHKELVVGSNEHFSREEIVQQAIDLAADFYGVSQFHQIIAVGDGIWDWRTAKNLDLHFIGIGEKNKAELMGQNSPVHIKDWTNFDLATVLETIGKG